jgi:hypothetical protein
MATRFVFDAYSAAFPSASFPTLQLINRHPVLSYSSASSQRAYFEAVTPCGWVTPFSASVLCLGASTTQSVVMEVYVEAISASDALDMASTDSFDTTNNASMVSPSVAGHLFSIPITLTNNDSSAQGDHIRFAVTRSPSLTADASSASVHFLKLIVSDGA